MRTPLMLFLWCGVRIAIGTEKKKASVQIRIAVRVITGAECGKNISAPTANGGTPMETKCCLNCGHCVEGEVLRCGKREQFCEAMGRLYVDAFFTCPMWRPKRRDK